MFMTRKLKLKLNATTSLFMEITTIICGILLPRFILQQYGSEVNGLINSITQFLSVVSFLELGVGAVVQSSLYKPLVDKNSKEISRILSSAQKYFDKIAIVLILYIIVLICIYPKINNSNFDVWYIGTLIIATGINLLGQYFFGIVSKLLLDADQKGYIYNALQSISIIINTIICIALIRNNVSIQTVKIVTSLIYLVRPILLKLYVKKNYCVNYNVKYFDEPIKQKWNGIAQHVAAVVLNQTDVIVLTMFSSLNEVSIYSVYYLVINGIKTLIMSFSSGIQSIFGEFFAKKDKRLVSFFGEAEWLLHNLTVLLFSCTGLLIVQFVEIYTKGIEDVNYINPSFAMVITIAHACHCLRLPYNMMILAAGHYKQTQHNYIFAAILNIVISIIVVQKNGLIGVAIGTLIAMLYQTVWMALYCYKSILNIQFKIFLKQLLLDITIFIIAYLFCTVIHQSVYICETNYISWALLGIKVVITVAIISITMNCVFFYDNVKKVIYKLLKK